MSSTSAFPFPVALLTNLAKDSLGALRFYNSVVSALLLARTELAIALIMFLLLALDFHGVKLLDLFDCPRLANESDVFNLFHAFLNFMLALSSLCAAVVVPDAVPLPLPLPPAVLAPSSLPPSESLRPPTPPHCGLSSLI